MFCFFCLLFLFITLGLFFYKKRITIAFLFSLEWTILAILNFVMDMPIEPWAYIFVFLCIFFFSLSSFLNFRVIPKVSSDDLFEKTITKYSKYIFYINLIATLYLGYKLGFSSITFSSVSQLSEQMNVISRYCQ